ncbi:alpha-amylase-like isoform X2 [Bradysia coprophila]|uniref:alpha-amylase-like isoform X2 n=1 Tax=Bradysia coprophila TaxID=38358 RepID=UPI00187DCD35|nr:alpha-amylase-like isoform X2 [Bradysia coprophila]
MVSPKEIFSHFKLNFRIMSTILIFKLIIMLPAATLGFPKITHFDLNQLHDRSVIIHLFEWKFSDIGLECERFLGPQGYGAVQLSPANEHLVVQGHPFWERYQPISYIIQTRSGNSDDFQNMSRRCNENGVRIYADVVLNHMAAINPKPIIGSAGSMADPENFSYPSVPYKFNHFNKPCDILDWNNETAMRNCQVTKGSRDLDQTQEYVRNKIVDYMNELIRLGVSGFRIDSAKHMWPSDLEIIFSRLNNLNVDFGFASNSRPFIYHDLKDSGTDTDTMGRWEYTHLGMITEFAVPGELGRAFRGKIKLKYLRNFGPQWNFLPSKCAIAFVEDHELQRGLGMGSGPDILTNKNGKSYKMAIAFLLAHPYGTARLTSSYNFRHVDDGPPSNMFGEIESPITSDKDDRCQHGWVCEHRWNSIANMVRFRNEVYGSSYSNWWDNNGKQVAFSRGEKGFTVWNLDDYDLKENMQTCLPAGTYCDVISGTKNQNKCTGTKVEVNEEGIAHIFLSSDDANGVMAIHTGAVLGLLEIFFRKSNFNVLENGLL